MLISLLSFRFSVLMGPIGQSFLNCYPSWDVPELTKKNLLSTPDTAHIKHLISPERLPFTAAYFGSLGLTLYFAVGVRGSLFSYPSPLRPCVASPALADRASHTLLSALFSPLISLVGSPTAQILPRHPPSSDRPGRRSPLLPGGLLPWRAHDAAIRREHGVAWGGERFAVLI
jgi:hypothetical protein